uniref:iron-containing alcohol dehydrogenase n=1 Tax=Klebsiella pneumoniae TaxID=573 RepID=UPI000E3CD729
HALKLLNHNLPKVLKNGNDLEARQNMLFGSMLAGQAFANSPVAAVHALAYPLGGHFHLSHGHTNATNENAHPMDRLKHARQ